MPLNVGRGLFKCARTVQLILLNRQGTRQTSAQRGITTRHTYVRTAAELSEAQRLDVSQPCPQNIKMVLWLPQSFCILLPLRSLSSLAALYYCEAGLATSRSHSHSQMDVLPPRALHWLHASFRWAMVGYDKRQSLITFNYVWRNGDQIGAFLLPGKYLFCDLFFTRHINASTYNGQPICSAIVPRCLS